MWLCRLIGHKHVRYGLGWAQFVLDYCLRCHANTLTPSGDGALLCTMFGHKTRKELVGDYQDQVVRLMSEEGKLGCFRCHASAGAMTSGA